MLRKLKNQYTIVSGIQLALFVLQAITQVHVFIAYISVT